MLITSSHDLNIVKQLQTDRPSFHLGGHARWDSLPQTLNAIRSAVKPGDVTIETGVGASTVVFTAGGSTHTAISPDPREHELIREYCRSIGVDDSRLNFVVGLSEDVLPDVLTRERTLDVAFIDGAHSFPFPEVDWCYITRSLKVGGYLVVDDITIPSVAPLYRHMTLEANWALDRVLDDRAAAFRLQALPLGEDWGNQKVNARYPDYQFADLPKRVQLELAHRVTKMSHAAARRNPALRRIYKRLTEKRASG